MTKKDTPEERTLARAHAWALLFLGLGRRRTMGLFLDGMLRAHRRTYAKIAVQYGLSRWTVTAAAHGKIPMTPRVRRVLEEDLLVDLGPFLPPSAAK